MNYKIKEAQKKDINELVELLIDFKINLTPLTPLKAQKTRKEIKPKYLIKKYLEKEICNKKNLFLVAEKNNSLVGFVLGKIKIKEHSVFKEIKYGSIENLWVCEKHRRKGLSKEFYKTLLNWFKKNNCKYISIKTLSKNPIKKIYEKWGFESYIEEKRKFIK